MQASIILSLKNLLSLLAIALVLAAPCAFAKKDLFATEPSAKQTPHIEQLAPNTSHSSSSIDATTADASTEPPKSEEKIQITDAKTTPKKESENNSSYLEKQLKRLKGHLVEAKEDLFGSKKSVKKAAPSISQQTEAVTAESAHSSDEAQPDTPTISATEAAQHAQALAEGQVINVRKYMEDDKPRYAVKLLQKNGRMKTINLDAVSGALVEETPQ